MSRLPEMVEDAEPAWLAQAGDLDELASRLDDAVDARALRQGCKPADLSDEETSAAMNAVVLEWSRRGRMSYGLGLMAAKRALYTEATRSWDVFFVDYVARADSGSSVGPAVSHWLAAERAASLYEEQVTGLLVLGHLERRAKQHNRRRWLLNAELTLSGLIGRAMPGLDGRAIHLQQASFEIKALQSGAQIRAMREHAGHILKQSVIPALLGRLDNPAGLQKPITAAVLAYRCGECTNPALMRERSMAAQDWLAAHTRYGAVQRR